MRRGMWILLGCGCLLACSLCMVIGGGAACLGSLLVRSVPGLEKSVPREATPVYQPPSLTPAPLVLANPVPAPAEEDLTSLESAVVPASDLVDLAERLGGKQDVPRVVASSAEPIPLGTVRTFYASNADTNENFRVEATLRYATPHVYFWVEQGINASDQDIQALVDRFEEKTYPTDRQFFGSEWTPGVDGDVHVYILLTRNLGSSVAGYFSPDDEYSPLAQPFSNAHEMFYLNTDALSLTDDYTGGVLAHEFQHMIRWYQNRSEDAWLNEGASVLAEFLNGFSLGGFDLAYAQNTNLQLDFWPDPQETNTSPHYGASFLFLDYILNRVGRSATQALLRDPGHGLEGVDDTLRQLGEKDPQTGRQITADDVFADFAAALYLDNPAVGDGRFAFSNDPQAPHAQVDETVTTCPTGVESREVAQYGIDYILIRCVGDYHLHLVGQSEARVVPTNPAQGQYDIWSNEGDDSDTTLTRGFDLPPATPITLRYQAWFDIEKDYDYAYLEVSTDSGRTWRTLHTPSGTDRNPQGNNYGWGYTGESGGGDTPAWITENVDLSAYAGKHILLRFEYITDPEVNGGGLLLDNLSIPQLGYQADFEQNWGGWVPSGFVRLRNEIPQTYRALLILQQAKGTSVQPIALNDREYGEASLSLKSGDTAVLVVMGTTPFTRLEAPFQYEITP